MNNRVTGLTFSEYFMKASLPKKMYRTRKAVVLYSFLYREMRVEFDFLLSYTPCFHRDLSFVSGEAMRSAYVNRHSAL